MNVSIEFSADAAPATGTLAILAAPDRTPNIEGTDAVGRAIEAAGFKAGFGKTLDVFVPEGSTYDRVIVLGTGDGEKKEADRWARLGGSLQAAAGKAETIAVRLDDDVSAEDAAGLAMGIVLAGYDFDRYKTTKKDDKDKGPKRLGVSIHTPKAKAAKTAWDASSGIADGVMLARELVNEPANVLTPKRFAKRVKQLKKLGCDVTILGGGEMKDLKMRALLGVSRGSRNPPRMAIVEWNGGKKGDKPLAFVGKGVTFDTGGISIKPSSGMEDMKGDMGGAAAVTGLMHALASRKAKANVVGIVALVENMPDGDAQRPGDIVKSMSGQTIEIINTDAEGRLILADALTHCIREYEPRFVVDLATLTGAILVALGNHHAGLFSNDDDLSEKLTNAGLASNERVWRLPLGPDYDKLIDTKNADMKNTGGRMAGSITAAQFLQRFVDDTPWAHLDIAGTGFGSPKTEISTGWASGFGVRLLNQLVAEDYEA